MAVERRSASLFPIVSADDGGDGGGGPPLNKETLPEYVGQWNRNHQNTKIHLWRRTKGQSDDLLTVLRFAIPDVLIVYVSLALPAPGAALVVESVTAFAPREKVGLAWLFS